MDLDLVGRRAAVMASSDGIGKAIACALAREGVHVMMCGRHEEKLAGAAEEARALAGHGAEVATQVIEHVPHPQKMMMECGRVLKPGGYLILSGPFYWPLHEEPFDFYRFTKYGFAQMLKDAGFSSWEIKEDGGDWAQLMLALNLKLCKRWMAPLRCIVNIVGLTLNQAFLSTKSSANYTVLAKL